MEALSGTSHISCTQQTPVARGYHITQHRPRTFPSSQTLLVECTIEVTVSIDNKQLKGIRICHPKSVVWHKDYFVPQAINKQETQKQLSALPLSKSRKYASLLQASPSHTRKGETVFITGDGDGAKTHLSE